MSDPTNNAVRRKHSRGYLPHFDVYGTIQFVTFRLADSMPQELLESWQHDLENGFIEDVDLRRRVERYLDSGYGSCFLLDRRIATELRETLLKWDGERYNLIAWVIMPNHVHILIELLGVNALSDIMHSIKSYTAHKANKLLDRRARFWSVESYDRYIRDANHLRSTIKYIEENPVKVRLCRKTNDWEFSSGYRSR